MENDKFMISMDLKKYRIRIHKGVLHRLGEPKRVQLLLNPEKRALIISCPSRSISESQDEKVIFDKPGTDGSYQLYSMTLFERIRKICPELQDRCLYHIPGKYLAGMNAGFFSMDDCVMVSTAEEKEHDGSDH